jgi:hypothetical protein
MGRRDEGLENDSFRAERNEGDESYPEGDQRLADEDRETRDLERERADLERRRDIDATRNADRAPAVDQPTAGDQLGEAVGGISGVVAGAAIGSLGGPIGTLIGGIAGAIGGWWAGRAIAEGAPHVTDADDEHYRAHYESLGARRETSSYDEARPAYHLGHIAGYNPGYSGREFDEIEPELERGWTSAAETVRSQWTGVREYARAAYTRSRDAARDSTWLTQKEAVRTGDSFENATPDLASSAASRPALEGEEISPAMLDYMADDTADSGSTRPLGNRSDSSSEPNRGLSSQGSSGSFASSSSGSVPADAETPRGTSERASSIEAVPDPAPERARVADNFGGSAERKEGVAPDLSASSASGGTGESSSGMERPSFNDPAGPSNADRSLSSRGDEGAVFSMDDERETRSIGDADDKDGRGMREGGEEERY